jgi:hypothetical protein
MLLRSCAVAGLAMFASACFSTQVEAHGDWRGRYDDRPSFGELRRGCDAGYRRACIGMGRVIEQRREARREARRDRWRAERQWEWENARRGWR